MNASDLTDFRSLLQEELQDTWPAEISLDEGATVIACACGSFNDGEQSLDAGGIFPTYTATFRVLASAFETLPEVGHLLQWRMLGETEWRQTLRIDRIQSPVSDPSVTLSCGPATKPN